MDTKTERRRRAVELYGQGLSTKAVAAELGCALSTAWSDLKAAGVEFRHTNEAKTEPRECAREGCEEPFRPTAVQLRNGYGKFCSRQCDHEAHRIYAKPAERVCAREGCEERFTPTGSNVAYGWGKFCSNRCAALSTGAHQKKKGDTVTCEHCGKAFWRYDCEIKTSERLFCGLPCATKYRWEHGIAISDDVVSLISGRSRQKWKGRWNGHKGAAAGIEAGRAKGGRPAKWSADDDEQARMQQEILRLDQDGLTTRQIAEAVFGDARYKDRVARFLIR